MSPNEAIDHESAFIQAFVRRESRERLRFELKKNRDRFLNRFCHTATQYLDPRYLIEIPAPNSSSLDLLRLLQERGATKDCHAISTHPELDGKPMNLESALKLAVGFGSPTILSCIPGKLAYLETEQEFGPPPRYLLRRPHEDRET